MSNCIFCKYNLLSLSLFTDCIFKDVNNKLKNYCNSAGMDFIDNLNIERSCLNRGKLNLNRKGTAALTKNLGRFVRSLPVDSLGVKVRL